MRNRTISIIGVCLLTVMLFSPCISYGAAKEVIYLSLADYTGPSAGLDSFIQLGTEDYFKFINEKGGVQGIKIKFIGIDTRADVARVVSGYKRYRRNPKVLAFWNNSSPSNKVIIPLATRDKRVMLTPASGEAVAKPGFAFCWGQTYQDGFSASIDWMIEDWKKKGNAGLPKVGYLSWDNGYGRAHLQGGAEYAQKKGIQLLTEFFKPGTPDHTTYLTRLKSCNYIFAGGVDPTPTNIIRDAHRLGMLKDTQFVCDYWGPSRSKGSGIAMHPEELQGTVVVSFFLRGVEIAAHPFVKEVWQKYHKEPVSEILGGYGAGFTLGMAFVEALKIALQDKSYEELGNKDMQKAYFKLTGSKFAQGIQTACTYSPEERRGSKGVKFYRVKGMDLVPITDWINAPDSVSLHKW